MLWINAVSFSHTLNSLLTSARVLRYVFFLSAEPEAQMPDEFPLIKGSHSTLVDLSSRCKLPSASVVLMRRLTELSAAQKLKRPPSRATHNIASHKHEYKKVELILNKLRGIVRDRSETKPPSFLTSPRAQETGSFPRLNHNVCSRAAEATALLEVPAVRSVQERRRAYTDTFGKQQTDNCATQDVKYEDLYHNHLHMHSQLQLLTAGLHGVSRQRQTHRRILQSAGLAHRHKHQRHASTNQDSHYLEETHSNVMQIIPSADSAVLVPLSNDQTRLLTEAQPECQHSDDIIEPANKNDPSDHDEHDKLDFILQKCFFEFQNISGCTGTRGSQEVSAVMAGSSHDTVLIEHTESLVLPSHSSRYYSESERPPTENEGTNKFGSESPSINASSLIRCPKLFSFFKKYPLRIRRSKLGQLSSRPSEPYSVEIVHHDENRVLTALRKRLKSPVSGAVDNKKPSDVDESRAEATAYDTQFKGTSTAVGTVATQPENDEGSCQRTREEEDAANETCQGEKLKLVSPKHRVSKKFVSMPLLKLQTAVEVVIEGQSPHQRSARLEQAVVQLMGHQHDLHLRRLLLTVRVANVLFHSEKPHKAQQSFKLVRTVVDQEDDTLEGHNKLLSDLVVRLMKWKKSSVSLSLGKDAEPALVAPLNDIEPLFVYRRASPKGLEANELGDCNYFYSQGFINYLHQLVQRKFSKADVSRTAELILHPQLKQLQRSNAPSSPLARRWLNKEVAFYLLRVLLRIFASELVTQRMQCSARETMLRRGLEHIFDGEKKTSQQSTPTSKNSSKSLSSRVFEHDAARMDAREMENFKTIVTRVFAHCDPSKLEHVERIVDWFRPRGRSFDESYAEERTKRHRDKKLFLQNLKQKYGIQSIGKFLDT